MLKKKSAMAGALAFSIIAGVVQAQSSRESPIIAAGQAAYSVATTIAERANQSGKLKKPPVILSAMPESVYKQFCAGAGFDTPDMTLVYRPMTPAQQELCSKNGVKDIAELKIGQTAIVAATQENPRGFARLSRRDLFLAMAKDVPDPQGGGKLVPNPYKTWKEINSDLPDVKIQVLGPHATVAYYPVIVNEIMLNGCRQNPVVKNLETTEPKAFELACTTFRKDGAYSEYEDLNAVSTKLTNVVGIFTDAFATKVGLNKLPIDGIEPLAGAIAHGSYTLVGPLVMYVKKSHLNGVSGLKEYIVEAASENAASINGYLVQHGMVPLPLSERRKLQVAIQELTQ